MIANRMRITTDAFLGEMFSTSCSTISTERFVGSFGSQANFTCPIGHFMTEHTDLSTFAIMIPILLAAALFASFIPARRASRLDPMSAFRQE
jgi:ABC-type lipoprotein release transport system permease subunit